MPRLQIMDTTIRDGQQSLWATRMQIGDMLPILPEDGPRRLLGHRGVGRGDPSTPACAFWTRIPGSACAPLRRTRPIRRSPCSRAGRTSSRWPLA